MRIQITGKLEDATKVMAIQELLAQKGFNVLRSKGNVMVMVDDVVEEKASE